MSAVTMYSCYTSSLKELPYAYRRGDTVTRGRGARDRRRSKAHRNEVPGGPPFGHRVAVSPRRRVSRREEVLSKRG